MKRSYEKKYEFQKKLTLKQSEEIKELKSKIEELENKCKEKDKIINSIESLRNELMENINGAKESREKYEDLVGELIEMKKVMNQTVFKKKWKLIRFLMK
jgi:polyhydroxyalkanoate synthesis regulator phasin